MRQGKDIIKSYLTNIPDLPGVYRMLDVNRHIIYIGKAKNLKQRLSQYTLEQEGKNKIMVSLIQFIEYSITESESAALLLEGQLIKKYKPRFNILLKDDKSFPYIKLRIDHQYPQLLKYRGKNLNDGKFFGPFASSGHVDTTLLELQKIFRLRSCTDSYFENRKRPCIQYQIKRCYAPCVNKILKEEYDSIVSEVKEFLSGKSQKLQKMLSQKMEAFSKEMKYEKAAEIRDRIKAISYVQLKSENAEKIEDSDFIALSSKNGEFCIQLFIYRSYQPCGNQTYFPDHTYEASPSEVIENFIMQLYQNKKPPKELIISHDIADKKTYELALKELHKTPIKIIHPKLGVKKKVLDNAIYNSEISLEKHLKISAKNIEALNAVQKLFDLKDIPKRIEVYDNSHIQGSFAVGAMVVAGIDGFDKKEYRLFNIKENQQNSFGGDDYAMLREVLTRRFKRIKTEPYRKPDFMIIDGGKGHMKIVSEVMENLDVIIPFVCMSKGVDRNSGREQFHRPNYETFTLDRNLQVMKYLQILRDEVHNFAIKSHRSKRSKAIRISSLDNIQGIGSARKKALLNYFGSFKAIMDATVDELTKVDGISKELAQTIVKSKENF
jgi:excinuclease ABC subunit C